MMLLRKWMQPGLRLKRWLLLLAFGLLILGIGFAQAYVLFFAEQGIPPLISNLTLGFLPPFWRVVVAAVVGLCAVAIAIYELNNSIVQPIASRNRTPWVDLVAQHNLRQRGVHVVVIGGGTGLPSVLRGIKQHTSNITAIVTVADDGGSSGRLRRELGVLPPGDLRNNIAALADDEDMMTNLFQYRFGEGGLGGHSFGNLFLTALSEITGDMHAAVAVAGRVLAITGRVLPSTLHNVNLGADIRQPNGKLIRVMGESNIPETPGQIERVFLEPENVQALPDVRQAILSANVIVIGPGSLYTSIIPNLMIHGVVPALKATLAPIIYVCNIAQQPGETLGYTVAEHIEALEQHMGGRSIIDYVLANNVFPELRTGDVTEYVLPAPPEHPVQQRYQIVMADLAEDERPWRHDSRKLATQILKIAADYGNKVISITA